VNALSRSRPAASRNRAGGVCVRSTGINSVKRGLMCNGPCPTVDALSQRLSYGF